jgi:HK97 family phage prohead protease
MTAIAEENRKVVREGLLRTAPFTLAQRAAGEDGEADDGLTLEGHAAVFGARTVINSWWEGRFTEEIAPGAFKKTFRERVPVLQFDHGTHPLVGSIPIGRIKEVLEDDIGAYTRARLHDNWLVQPVRDAIAEESITGMSFRFSVVREEWRDEDGKIIKDDDELLQLLWADTDAPYRTLKELRVPELGPVVFPAYDETEVGVRSATAPMTIDLGQLATNREARAQLARSLFLAERATLSRSETGTPDPVEEPPAGDSGGTPATDEAPPAGDESTQQAADRTAELAERMQSLNRR